MYADDVLTTSEKYVVCVRVMSFSNGGKTLLAHITFYLIISPKRVIHVFKWSFS